MKPLVPPSHLNLVVDVAWLTVMSVAVSSYDVDEQRITGLTHRTSCVLTGPWAFGCSERNRRLEIGSGRRGGSGRRARLDEINWHHAGRTGLPAARTETTDKQPDQHKRTKRFVVGHYSQLPPAAAELPEPLQLVEFSELQEKQRKSLPIGSFASSTDLRGMA